MHWSTSGRGKRLNKSAAPTVSDVLSAREMPGMLSSALVNPQANVSTLLNAGCLLFSYPFRRIGHLVLATPSAAERTFSPSFSIYS